MSQSKQFAQQLLGKTLKGSYRIDAELGHGSMGTVFRGTQTTLSRPVAIKVINPHCLSSKEYIDRFMFEAQVASQLSHPNVVNVIDFGQDDDGLLFLVMEYLEGELLNDYVPDGGLTLDQTAWIAQQVCAGISAVHAIPIVHRDIKPNNIIVAKVSGGASIVKVLDFGICKATETDDHAMTQAGAIIGTPGYISPEQIHFEHSITTLSDVYAIGSLIYFLITGNNPYKGSSTQILIAQQTAKPPKRLSVSKLNDSKCKSLWPIIQKAMSYYPEDRYQTVHEVAAAISDVASAELPTVAYSPDQLLHTQRRQLKSRIRYGSTVMLTTIAVFVAGLLAWNEFGPSPLPSAEFSALESQVPTLASSSDTLLFGMTGDLSGFSAYVGTAMQRGIEARFNEQNDQGGIHGQRLELIALDDAYDPLKAKDNVDQLVNKYNVTGVIGTIGTATSVAVLPTLVENQRLLFGAYTGAHALRSVPPNRYVFNFRASYDDELDKIMQYFHDVKKLQTSEIAIFRPKSSIVDSETWSIEDMGKRLLAKYRFDPEHTLDLQYDLQTGKMDQAVALAMANKEAIKAVINLGPYSVSAAFIKQLHDQGYKPWFANLSFVGTEQLATALAKQGVTTENNVIVTQVVPSIGSHATSVRKFRAALTRYFPDEPPTAAALEGYLSASLLVHGLARAKTPLDAENIIDALEQIERHDLGTGAIIELGPSDHEASENVWALLLHQDGIYRELKYY